MPQFDITSDGRFQSLLDDLPDRQSVASVVMLLQVIQKAEISWKKFTIAYGWTQLQITGSDDFAGRPDYRSFVIETRERQTFEIVGYSFQEAGIETVIVCAIARSC